MEKKYGVIIGLIALVILILIGCASSTQDEVNGEMQRIEMTDQTIVVGTSGGYHPYTFRDESGNLSGFEIDVWHEIDNRIDYDVEFVTAEFSGLFGMLDTSKIDTIANQITITDQRQEKYDFTTPYVFSGAQLIVQKGNDQITSFEDLKGYKVGVSLGSNYEQLIKDYDVNDEIEVITYEDYLGSLQDVSLGRIDAVLNDKLAAVENINQSGLNIQLGGEPTDIIENAFPFVNNEDQILKKEAVNEALQSMNEDGTLEEISKKWFKTDITSVEIK